MIYYHHMRIQTSLLLMTAGIVTGGALVGLLVWRTAPTKNRIDLSHDAVVTRMQTLGRLETASFTIEKIIDAGSGPNGGIKGFLFGDKLLLIAQGNTIAGVDLALLGPNDVTVNGTTAKIKLPAPSIFSATLDSSKTKVYDRTHGILASPDKDLESEARIAAEKAIRQAACDGGILVKASQSSEKEIRALLSALGFTEINIEVGIPTGC